MLTTKRPTPGIVLHIEKGQLLIPVAEILKTLFSGRDFHNVRLRKIIQYMYLLSQLMAHPYHFWTSGLPDGVHSNGPC